MGATAPSHRPQKASPDRKESRHSVHLRVDGLEAEGDRFEATIHDLSGSGCLIETDRDLNLGDRIGIHVNEDQPVAAKVVWCQGRFYGCEIFESIDRASLSAARLRSPHGAKRPSINESADEFSTLSQFAEVVTPTKRLTLGTRALVVSVLGVVAWVPFLAVGCAIIR